MPFSTYAELQTAIKDWLAQSDVGGVVQDLIVLAESRHRRDLRVRQMIAQDTGTLSTKLIPLPERWVETVRLYVDAATSQPVLEYRSPTQLENSSLSNGAGGVPQIYSHTGSGSIEVAPLPDDTYTYYHDFYQYPEPLSDAAPTNWLLQEAPGIYLYGSLIHAEPYLGNDPRLSTWTQLYESEVNMLQKEDSRAKYRPGARMTAGPAAESRRRW